MEAKEFFQNVVDDINNSSVKSTRRKVKTIFTQLGAKTTSSQKVVDCFNQNVSKFNLETDTKIEFGMSNRSYITFGLKGIAIKNPKVENLEREVSLNKIQLPDDFFRNLFEFESEQEYERFQACLDSYYPMAIFLLPLRGRFLFKHNRKSFVLRNY